MIKRLINYIYSLYFCLRYLPFKQAIKVPILVRPFLKIGELHRGSIILEGSIYRAMVSWGFDGVEGRVIKRCYVSIHNGGKLILRGNTIFLKGTGIVIDSAKISIGENFLCNCDSFLCATRHNITIGNDCLFGWNVQLNTTDGHATYVNGILNEASAPITIGNHVWIGADNLIFKRSVIPDGCIVAQRSLVSKSFSKPCCLLAGIPAKVIRENVDWKR